MDIRDINSSLHIVNKLLENIDKKYNINLATKDINEVLVTHKRKLQWMVENVKDDMNNASYIKSKMIFNAASMTKNLLESCSNYYIDASSGTVIDKTHKTTAHTPMIGLHEVKRMNEDMTTKNHILMLAESEIEKAQIVMAVHNEIVEKLQRDAEKMSNMKIDVLGPIVERIKAEHGLAPAENFRDTITRLLDQALDVVMTVKDQINTETLKLTGDISSAPTIEQDLSAGSGLEATLTNPTMAGIGSSDFEFDEEFTTPDTEPVVADREMKESIKRLGIVVESKSGKTGEKYFTDVKSMRSWIAENQSKITKVHKILKD